MEIKALFLLFIFGFANCCVHDKVFSEEVYHVEEQVYQKSDNKALAGLTFEIVYHSSICLYVGQPLDWITGCGATQRYFCKAEDILTSAKESFLKDNIIPQALAFWSDKLSVDSSGVSISYPKCCGMSITPKTSKSSYILYISFHPTTGTTLAWAGACLQDQYGRPIAGQANFGPNQINVNDTKQAYMTAVHELGHALGFSSSLYNSYKYRNSKGELVSHSKVTNTFTERGHTVTKIVTPKVTEFVKNHFNCPSMTNAGAEIEDGGSSGTAGSHFEKRIFHNEIMTGSVMKDTIITPMTLALFADMGWYTLSSSTNSVSTLTWGKGLGCSFALDKCSNWNSKYFCSSTRCQNKQFKGCTYDYKAKAYCSLTSYTAALPTYYQYFSDPVKGGQDQLADFCPIYEGYSNGYCTDTTQTGQSILGEVYSSDSICFQSTALKTGQGSTITDECGNQQYITCHRRTCLNAGTSSAKLRVYLGTGYNDYIDCPTSGGTVDIYNNLSSKKSSCSDNAQWKTKYQFPAKCSDFAESGCSAYSDIGQFTNCPATCKICSAYTGVLTCPPVSDVCSTASSSNKSLSDGSIAGIVIGVAASGIIAGLIYKKVSKKKPVPTTRALLISDDRNM
eukprot:c20874_g1_i1.p1 GENE.c20874_g1_i1~~c20874_g1_i1.p1  ORF type:complete len:639 (-),score=246.94 c20874_g1_i1:355-2217(-)